jgi:murein DD-endopeptidase MepM/ murein hydrolase activator NlpD
VRFYEPIDGLLGPRRRKRRSKTLLSVLVLLAGGVAAYLFIPEQRTAEGVVIETDRLLTLQSPDFTTVFSGEEREALANAEASDVPRAPGIALGRPHFVEGAIRRNQTLFVAMRDAGAEPRSIQEVVDSHTGIYDFRRSQPGHQWEARLDEEGRITQFRYTVSPEEVYEALREPDGRYTTRRVDIPVQTVVASFGGVVMTSLSDAVAEEGEGTLLATRFMEIFQWDMDFSRHTRPGDVFRMIVEKVYLDGDFLRYGRVLAAEYQSRDRVLQAFAHTDEEDDTEYYTPEGDSLRRTFLQAPLRYRRISSEFTRRRFHPVLQRYRAHLGVDYAAASGTPVWAIADGTVRFAGERGGNGNLVVLEHEGGYETSYAHLLRFARGARAGREVEQGEVIGFVGSTGLSTGPHLHFGVRHDGEWVDPLGVDGARAPSLEGEALRTFQGSVARWRQQLEAIPVDTIDIALLPVDEVDEAHDDLPGDFGVEGEVEDVHE